jgi:hypothetical protein
MGLPSRTALAAFVCCAACAKPSAVPSEKMTKTSGVSAPTEAAPCRGDEACVLNPVDCSECGRCPGDEPSATMRAMVDSLRLECERHPPVRLNPRAAALGLRPPACSPCNGGMNEPRPLWRAVCKGGSCAAEYAGTLPASQSIELSTPLSPAAAPGAFPPLDASCSSDVDCALLSSEIEDDHPRTRACCPGRTARAASRAWVARFRQACESAPPPQCPPIGCPTPHLHAVCLVGQCTAVR